MVGGVGVRLPWPQASRVPVRSGARGSAARDGRGRAVRRCGRGRGGAAAGRVVAGGRQRQHASRGGRRGEGGRRGGVAAARRARRCCRRRAAVLAAQLGGDLRPGLGPAVGADDGAQGDQRVDVVRRPVPARALAGAPRPPACWRSPPRRCRWGRPARGTRRRRSGARRAARYPRRVQRVALPRPPRRRPPPAPPRRAARAACPAPRRGRLPAARAPAPPASAPPRRRRPPKPPPATWPGSRPRGTSRGCAPRRGGGRPRTPAPTRPVADGADHPGRGDPAPVRLHRRQARERLVVGAARAVGARGGVDDQLAALPGAGGGTAPIASVLTAAHWPRRPAAPSPRPRAPAGPPGRRRRGGLPRQRSAAAVWSAT